MSGGSKRHRSKSNKSPPGKTDEKAARSAALEYERAERQREIERRKEEAAMAKERQRREQAIVKAQAAPTRQNASRPSGPKADGGAPT